MVFWTIFELKLLNYKCATKTTSKSWLRKYQAITFSSTGCLPILWPNGYWPLCSFFHSIFSTTFLNLLVQMKKWMAMIHAKTTYVQSIHSNSGLITCLSLCQSLFRSIMELSWYAQKNGFHLCCNLLAT